METCRSFRCLISLQFYGALRTFLRCCSPHYLPCDLFSNMASSRCVWYAGFLRFDLISKLTCVSSSSPSLGSLIPRMYPSTRHLSETLAPGPPCQTLRNHFSSTFPGLSYGREEWPHIPMHWPYVIVAPPWRLQLKISC